jgi:class 3 adenylate cyclase/predicted ATPase
MNEREQLEQAITALEAQRTFLGDAVVDAALGPMREKLAALQGKLQLPEEKQQRKQITVLFADVSGFTKMSEQLDPEEVNEIMNTLWSRLDKTIIEHGGFIDKHIGDALMALFGAPIAQEDDPERAIRAALGMQAEIKKWKAAFSEMHLSLQDLVQNIEMRIGINTGPVLLGTVGTTSEYTAIGDTVNLASRLEHAAPVGGVLVSQDTYRHVRGIFEVTPLDPIQVKGKSEPVQVYVVNARRPRSFRITSRGVEGIETRTIGREVELGKMMSALKSVMETGRLHLINIVAEAGTGKSRLLYEFIKWLEEQHYPLKLFKGRAMPEMKHSPYSLIRNLLATSFEIQDSDTASVAREKLEQGILDYAGQDQNTGDQAPFIGYLIGYDYVGDPRLAGIHEDARQIRDLAFHYLTQFFVNALQDQPGVMLLEDIHWTDSGSLDLIDHVMKNQPNLPLLIICLTRPMLFEARPDWGKGPFEHLRLDLQPLNAQDSRQLVADILRKVPEVPPALVDLIIERAEGSPFYVEELIKALIEEGIILRDAQQWQVQTEQLTDLKVPATLTGVLQARLDNLPVADREVLQRASVVGRVFWDKVVEHMHNPETSVSGSPVQVAERLEMLEKKELVFHRDPSAFVETPEYIFKHAILHDVTYESVLLRLRKIYHAQVAENLIELGRERVNEYAGRIGEHFELAEEWTRAAEWYVRAGVQAQETYAPEGAINYFQKALRFLKDRTEPEQIARKLEICQGLGEVLNWQARYTEAADIYKLMLELAQKTGDHAIQSRAVQGLATSLTYLGDHREALENAAQAETLAREANSPKDLVISLWIQGFSHFRLGETQMSLSLAERGLAIARDLNDRNEMARCLNLLGAVNYISGLLPLAEEHFENALSLFQELGNRRKVVDLFSNLGVISEVYGDYDTALERYQKALEVAREVGYRDGEIIFLTNRGGVQVGLQNFGAAESDLREAIQLAGAAGSYVLSQTYGYLAEAYVGQHKIEEALVAAQQALALGQESESPEDIGVAWRALGMICEQTGGPVTVSDQETERKTSYEAEECFEQSAKVLSEVDLDGEGARTLREWAKYELRRGNRDKGMALWSEARETFEKLGALMEVERMANPDP